MFPKLSPACFSQVPSLKRSMAVFGFLFTSSSPLTMAHSADDSLTGDVIDRVIVHGRGFELIGETRAASEGVVGYADFEDRALSRVGELVEVIPGVVATQHSGEGKANQYFLRGFNLDHGTDFSARLDGVPLNLRTHGHGQGYLDLNFIIPEIVEQVHFQKGSYTAASGDFSAAGSARFNTYDNLEEDFVEVSVGEFGFLRTIAAADFNLNADTGLLLAVEEENYDGPWSLDQGLEKLNAFGKLTRERGAWRVELSASAYENRWKATDQVPLRAVASGQITRFGYIDSDLGGDISRIGLNGQVVYRHHDESETSFNAFWVDQSFNLFSNFTYFADDAENGDEFEQLDKRAYYGATLVHSRNLSDRLYVQLGSETRFDDISDIGLFKTRARQRVSTVRRDMVDQLSVSFWGDAEYAISERFRANAGLRADYYEADVAAVSAPINGGEADDSLVSQNFGLAWKATDNLEVYVNYGEGFHSNDVRGSTIQIDPVSGDPVNRVPILVRAQGSELGMRLEQGSVRASIALFTLDLDSELVFVGDAGTTEANDGSTRMGVETSLFWQPANWLVLDLSAAYTDSKFDIAGPETDIPGAVKTVIGAGGLVRLDPWTFSARLRHFGAAPLIEDGSISSKPTTSVNLSGGYDWQNVRLSLELLNALDADDSDITYFFGSQLSGEAAPVDDIHFHPLEPRQVRLSLRYRF